MCIHKKIWNLKTTKTNTLKGQKNPHTAGEEIKIIISEKLNEESKN